MHFTKVYTVLKLYLRRKDKLSSQNTLSRLQFYPIFSPYDRMQNKVYTDTRASNAGYRNVGNVGLNGMFKIYRFPRTALSVEVFCVMPEYGCTGVGRSRIYISM